MKQSAIFLAGLAVWPVIANGQSDKKWGGDWCESLKNLGNVYENEDNPWVQKVEFWGRANYQWAHSDIEDSLDPDNLGTDFDGSGGELRRLRLGVDIEFLDGFTLEAGARFSRGVFRNESVGYEELDTLNLSYNFGDLAGFEDVTLEYGRSKFAFSGEWQTSSSKIKTVERSNLSNFFGRSRATGASLSAKRWNTDFKLGILSAQDDRELASWDGRNTYYGSVDVDLGVKKNLIFDFVYSENPILNPPDGAQEDVFDYDWAASLTYDGQHGAYHILANAIYGDAGAEDVYGFVLVPSAFLIEDRLEAVVRYQWARSTGEAFEINSRNIVRVADEEGRDLRGVQGRGRKNETIYAGLNYYFCGDNAKLMTGVEYETFEGEEVDLEATTFWASMRLFF